LLHNVGFIYDGNMIALYNYISLSVYDAA
jgi:hypothetical protein